MKRKPGIGAVVGRFQVPELHPGHRYVIDKANEHERLVIFVGCHPMLMTKASPLDFPTRKRMLEAEYPDAHVIALPDQPTDQGWSDTLDMLLRVHVPIGDPVFLYGSRDSFIPHYHGKFKTVELDPVDETAWSGTSVREEIKRVPGSSADFRKGVIYAAMNQYGRTRLCVDIAVVKFAGDLVLLGQKPNHPGHWRFPGGFVDGSDESTEFAARRELLEETGLGVNELHFLGGVRIQDWRDTPSDRCFTNFYRADYVFGMAKGSDDLPVVGWHAISGLRDLQMAGDHSILRDKLIEHMGRSCS